MKIMTVLVLAASVAVACAAAAGARATISFADLGGIRNWQADGSAGIYVESVHDKWYHATFFAPCYQLPVVEAVAFVTEPNGDLGRYSSILAGGDRCWFRDFEQSAAPPGSTGRHEIHEIE